MEIIKVEDKDNKEIVNIEILRSRVGIATEMDREWGERT